MPCSAANRRYVVTRSQYGSCHWRTSPSTKGSKPSKVAPSSLGAPLAFAPIKETMAALKPCVWRSANHSRACCGDSLVIRAQGASPFTRMGVPY